MCIMNSKCILMKYGFRRLKTFRIFIGRSVIKYYCIESVFGIEYVHSIVQTDSLRSGCCIRNVYGIKCGHRLIKVFGIVIAKEMVIYY